MTTIVPAMPGGVASGSGSDGADGRLAVAVSGRPRCQMADEGSSWIVWPLLLSEYNCNRAVFLRGHMTVSSAGSFAPALLLHRGPWQATGLIYQPACDEALAAHD